jgi:hypothetical protein
VRLIVLTRRIGRIPLLCFFFSIAGRQFCRRRARRGFHCRANILDRHVGVKFGRDGDGVMAEQRLHYLEVSGLAQRARSRGVERVMDPRVDAGIDPSALVGTDAVIGDRIALQISTAAREGLTSRRKVGRGGLKYAWPI